MEVLGVRGGEEGGVEEAMEDGDEGGVVVLQA